MAAKAKAPRMFAGLKKHKPSEWLEIALNDIKACRRQKSQFRIDMNQWFKPNGRCAVCLAGSVLAQTCRVPTTAVFSWQRMREGRYAGNGAYIDPAPDASDPLDLVDLPEGFAQVLEALNFLREGQLEDALQEFSESDLVPARYRARCCQRLAACAVCDLRIVRYDDDTSTPSLWSYWLADMARVVAELKTLGL